MTLQTLVKVLILISKALKTMIQIKFSKCLIFIQITPLDQQT